MAEIQAVSNEIVRLAVGLVGLILVLGVAIAGLETQISHLTGRPPSTNYSGKLVLLTLILGIAAVSVSISQAVAQALGL